MPVPPEPVFINGRFLAQRVTGVQRAAKELVRGLDELIAEAGRPALSFRLLVPPDADLQPLSPRAIEVHRTGGHTGYLWEQWDLARAARGHLLLNLGNVAPLLHRRNAILIHDAAVFDRPDGYDRRFRWAMRLLMPVLARRAAVLLTVSAFSAGRLERHGLTNGRGYTVLPSGADHIARPTPDPAALARHGLTPGRYLLFVGSPHPNKNLAGALAAIERVSDPDLRLAVVGAADARVFAPADRPRGDRATFLGTVDDAALAALYADALALLFPSYYEGSGIPPIEAMALGCPVIAGDRAAIPEVCGDAACLLDPDDTTGMAAAIDRLAADPGWRAALVERGRERSRRFNWKASAGLLMETLGPFARPASRSSG